MKILIVDDHAVFRRGLKDLLLEHFAGAKFGEAATAQRALEQVWKTVWDVMILDISMPGRSGLDILRDIRSVQSKLPVLILTAHSEEQYALRVLQAGAAGYVVKDTAPMELIRAVKTVLAGKTYVASSIVHWFRPGLERPSHQKLSNREFEILRMIATGFSSKAIAHDLHISPQTVTTYRARMLKKLEFHSTAELIRYAVEKKLIE